MAFYPRNRLTLCRLAGDHDSQDLMCASDHPASLSSQSAWTCHFRLEGARRKMMTRIASVSAAPSGVGQQTVRQHLDQRVSSSPRL